MVQAIEMCWITYANVHASPLLSPVLGSAHTKMNLAISALMWLTGAGSMYAGQANEESLSGQSIDAQELDHSTARVVCASGRISL